MVGRFTPDNEMYVTETERETNVAVSLAGSQAVADTRFYGLIDISDTVNWPHNKEGFVHVSFIRLTTDKAPSARGTIAIGIITRIDATNADVSYVSNLSFLENDSVSSSVVANLSPSQLKLNVENGTLKYTKAGVSETTALLQSDTPLSYAFTFTPAVGDIVMKIVTTTGGALNWTAGLLYHTDA